MVGKRFDVTNDIMCFPEMRWGPFKLTQVGMVSRPAGLYEKSISADMAGPIVGAISGNVLRHFRLDLDYPHQTGYLTLAADGDAADHPCVGLIVQVKEGGTVLVSGVAQRAGSPEVSGVQAGDVLLAINGRPVTGRSLATVLDALSGSAGEKKTLKLQRGGRVFQAVATVFVHP